MTIAGAGAPRKHPVPGFLRRNRGHDSFRMMAGTENTLFKTHRQMSTVM
jgi:hypothetical protein